MTCSIPAFVNLAEFIFIEFENKKQSTEIILLACPLAISFNIYKDLYIVY